jgi:GT2 family glycosyltransferase
MVGIIILNYDTYEETIKLVDELQEQSINNLLQIVVVDNASLNMSYTYLKPLEQKYANVTILETGFNLGYAKGNNYGLKYLEKNIMPEYVVILNNDVILPKNCLEKLCKKYAELDNPAIIAPIMTDVNGIKSYIYKINTFYDDILCLFALYKILPQKNRIKLHDNTGKHAMKVDIIPGSFMFSSFETFKSMGYFYPNTFLYAEERFVSITAKELKLNNYIILDQVYVHAHNSPTISSVYGQIAKYKLLYEGWLEFTLIHRKNGKFKTKILKALMKYSLWEMKLIGRIKGESTND